LKAVRPKKSQRQKRPMARMTTLLLDKSGLTDTAPRVAGGGVVRIGGVMVEKDCDGQVTIGQWLKRMELNGISKESKLEKESEGLQPKSPEGACEKSGWCDAFERRN